MANGGCKPDGSLNQSKFDEPMPWIGIYVATASLTCATAIAIDTLHAFKYKRFWFPCKFFSLNATTLTLITIAIKFSMDLNSTMPHRQDQLAKVSSSAFICTVMADLLPSLGTMKNTELFISIIALVILVITVISNICIQMGTGVIFVFWIEHAIILFIMLILLAIVCSLSLAVPTTKSYLDIKYTQKLKLTNIECFRKKSSSITEGIREDLRKYWILAYSSSPQFVIGRSAPCTASGAFCLLNSLILVEAVLRSYLMPWSLKFCNGESDYKWSTTTVLISQSIAVGIGTIAPAVRWFMAINFSSSNKAKQACNRELGVEIYWIKKLLEWQLQPLDFKISGHHGRKLVLRAKYRTLRFFIGLQRGIVFSCQIIRLVSIFFVGRFLDLKRFIRCKNSISSNDTELGLNLSRYVIHLGGEEHLVDLIMKNNPDATDHWIKLGETQKPQNLIKLLEKVDSSSAFTGVGEFDNDSVPSLGFAEPPNCWGLPVVTLTSIALALPSIDQELIKQLVSSVHEGLKYVREIENNLDEKINLKNVRMAEEIVWSGVELDRKWLDVDLCKIRLKGNGIKETIKSLSDISKKRFMEYGEIHLMHSNEWFQNEEPSRWCIRLLAANSMYRICETILLSPELESHESSQRLFEKLSLMICKIYSASFTNLQHVISKECRESGIEERELNIRHALLLFGETQEILRILDMKKIQDLNPGQLVHIDEWHLLCNRKQTDSLSYVSSSTNKESTIFSPSSLHISIE
ncbi:uncharacterized protein LOC112528593 [Cynara cardunculus var. scolymus]|uniref:Uncharacterized protein n=1 Tax=Cynara cardunculus var. scolymus TaxID=59895 RepID=A0A103XRG8_CYNCS|nr:uncharacterized protein LOC112528593 [Cynara cardunculus var. scolymus]KVH95505.1 hypothetical protein Ccrd_002411 [Cynara cardunculus var. scolymus]